jgi:hypothetical protein
MPQIPDTSLCRTEQKWKPDKLKSAKCGSLCHSDILSETRLIQNRRLMLKSSVYVDAEPTYLKLQCYLIILINIPDIVGFSKPYVYSKSSLSI